MRNLVILLTLILIPAQSLFCQQGQVINFGINNSDTYAFEALIDTEGNQYVVCSESDNSVVSKFDENFNHLWSIGVDALASYRTEALFLSNGDILLAIEDATSDKNHFIRIRSNGTVVWNKSMSLVNTQVGKMVEVSSENNIIMSFVYSNAPYLMCLSSSGDLLWVKKIILPENTMGNFEPVITKSSDGSVLLIGSSLQNMTINSRIFLMKLDESGNIIWAHNYSQSSQDAYGGRGDLIEHSNGFIYSLGTKYYSTHDSGAVIVRKFDNQGNFIEGRVYGDIYKDEAGSLVELENGNMVFSAVVRPHPFCGGNLLLSKISPNLDTLKTKVYGESAAEGAWFRNIHTQGDIIYSAGRGTHWSSLSVNDGHLIKFGSDLELPCGEHNQQINVYSEYDFNDTTNTFILNDVSIVSLSDESTISSYKYQIIDACTLDSLGSTHTTVSTTSEKIEGLHVYPNPSKGLVNLQLNNFHHAEYKLLNMNGQVIHSGHILESKMTIDLGKYENGIYLIKVTSEDKLYLEKIILNQ